MPNGRVNLITDGLDYAVKLPKGVFKYRADNKYRWRVSYYVGDKRKRKGFDSLSEALAFHLETSRQRKEEGERFGALAPNEKRAIEIFRAYRKRCKTENRDCRSLEDCMKEIIERENERNTSPAFGKVLEEYQGYIEKRRISDKSEKTFRIRIAPFEKSFQNKEIGQITSEEIDRILGKLKTKSGEPIAPLSYNHYRSAIYRVMKWAVGRKIIDENPVSVVFKQKVKSSEVGILSPQQFQKLLNAGLDYAPEIVPVLVAGGFCGVRRAELTRLRWSDIDMERKELKVPHISAKTGKGRFVPLPEVAMDWLKHALAKGIKQEGFLCEGVTEQKREGFLNRHLKKCRYLAGIQEWPNNALRHSFASHACSFYENFPQVATWLGHNGNLQVMMQHYRNVVTKEQGKQWFAIKID